LKTVVKYRKRKTIYLERKKHFDFVFFSFGYKEKDEMMILGYFRMEKKKQMKKLFKSKTEVE